MGRSSASQRAKTRFWKLLLGLVAVWLLFWLSHLDVSLRMGAHTIDGWWTARVNHYPIEGHGGDQRRVLWVRPDRRPNSASPVGYTPEAFEMVQAEVRRAGVQPLPDAREAEVAFASLNGDNTKRIYGRGYVAGLARQVVYRFEALEPPTGENP